MKKLAAIIAIVLLVGAGAFALSKRSDTNKTPTPATTTTNTTTNNTTPSTNNTATNTQPQSANTITYSSSGFSPSSLTVKAGATLTIKNDSSRSIQFDSNPHPNHTDDPELNVGLIKAGESKTITVTTTGNHGYHNHLNPSDTGSLIVQ